MRLTIPLTGTVLVEGSIQDGTLVGDNNDPIRPIDILRGVNVSWTVVNVDLENEVMVVEVEPAENVGEPDQDDQGNPKLYENGTPMTRARQTTDQEKVGFLRQAQALLMNKTKDELYAMSGNPRLKRPFR